MCPVILTGKDLSCGSFNASTTTNFPVTQYVSTQASAANPVLYDSRRSESFVTQAVAKKDARLAKLDAAQTHSSNLELHVHEIVQPHASGNNVATSDRQVGEPRVLRAEQLDLFGFHQCDVLTRVDVLSKIPITYDAHPALDGDVLTLHLRRMARTTDKNPLNVHRVTTNLLSRM
jgi:hypothetical protein